MCLNVLEVFCRLSSIIFIFVITILTNAWSAPPPDTFYVSPFGSDLLERSGSEAQPWRHINYAISRHEVNNGDIIIVLDDGVEETVDYVENIIVSKSLKIRGSDSNLFRPIVIASSPTVDVFDVTANNVEISELYIYGATSAAGIELNGVSQCLIQGNYCGISSTRKNAYGIQVSLGYQNVIRDNFANSNTIGGIYLWQTSGNRIEFNGIERNANGISVVQSGSVNLITFNVIRNNTDSGNGIGLSFGASTLENIVSGNIIEQNDVGIDLDGMSGGILTANRVRDNGVGLHVPAYARANSIFRNEFENSINIDSSATGYRVGSSVPIFYRYQSRYFKGITGNFYSDYAGSDATNDGIGDLSYQTDSYEDNHPLIDTTSSYRLYGWTTYLSGGIGRLVENSYSVPGDVVSLSPGVNKKFSTRYASTDKWIFRGGSESEHTTWTGWLTFASPPPAGHTVEITFGISDEGGADFEALGPVAAVTGDGTSRILYFTAGPNVLVLPKGKTLAVQLFNAGASSLEMFVGSAASMIFAPKGSRPFIPMPPLLLLLD